MICVAAGSKSRLARPAGAEVAAEQNEKLHAPVARIAFSNKQAIKKLRVSEHFCKFRYRKIARRCGAKHIFKLKC